MIFDNKKGSITNIIATIGAILIFVGIAWMIAKNWHIIPSIVKVFILVLATVAAFISGVIVRQKQHEGPARALITLGALLLILSLFLISQTYNLATTLQHYTWLLLISWVLILLSAYLLDSKENVVVAMLVFFNWIIFQYISTLMDVKALDTNGIILGVVFLYLSAGVLLYGMSILHNAFNHKFTNIYKTWTVFYFLIIFYLLSFQLLLPIFSEYTFGGGAFNAFLIIFIILCFAGLIIGAIYSAKKYPITIKEIMIFLGIIILVLILILSTKLGVDQTGTCITKDCSAFKNADTCNSMTEPRLCIWLNNTNMQGYCTYAYCSNYRNETDCSNAPLPLNCSWSGNYCNQKNYPPTQNDPCNNYSNFRSQCIKQPTCNWQSSSDYGFWGNRPLPTTLWLLWILNNIIFIGFIILMIWYGQITGSKHIINLSIMFFILDIVSRYIGFWLDFKGYLAFSILAIIGGILLIVGSIYLPKLRNKLAEGTIQMSKQDPKTLDNKGKK